jgi:CheY-like chemotaxis protein
MSTKELRMAKVLLVDDVGLFLELEKSYLEGLGYDLLTASSGEETLRRLEKIAPDVLLIDYYMPGINGDEVCRQLRKDPRWQKLPILMVTAAGKPEEVQSCLDAGCDDYITKPVNKAELQEKVQRLLGQVSRRTSERISVRLPILLQDGEKEQVASAVDLSTNGVCLKTKSPLALNSTVEMKLETPEGLPLTIFGKIKRAPEKAEDGCGVYFIYPDQQSKRLVSKLVKDTRIEQIEHSGVDDRLGKRLLLLEQECEKLRTEQEGALQRIGELEQENLDFANQLVQIEEVNNNLTNLYIASSRLHSTLDQSETLEIIKEVVINFVGAEKFAIFLFDQNKQELHFETGEGFDEDATYPEIRLGDGILGQAAAKRENFFWEGSVSEGSDDLLKPIVAIPLIIHEKLIGVLSIYRLFIQKEQLESIDYQLFSMLGEHAATALFSSTLYSRSERKRQTYQGVVDLILK